jgi:hypothetical protein
VEPPGSAGVSQLRANPMASTRASDSDVLSDWRRWQVLAVGGTEGGLAGDTRVYVVEITSSTVMTCLFCKGVNIHAPTGRVITQVLPAASSRGDPSEYSLGSQSIDLRRLGSVHPIPDP